MSGRLVRHRRFNTDVLQVFAQIGEENFSAANRFLRAVDTDLQKIHGMPGIGAIRTFRRAKLRGIRSLPVSGYRNYLIFYRVDQNHIEVLRLIHGARNLERALME